MVAERKPLERRPPGRRHFDSLRHRATYQPSHFGRVYAAYGAWFIILSILWGWLVDKVEPDRLDVIGATVCLVGVAVMMYWPR